MEEETGYIALFKKKEEQQRDLLQRALKEAERLSALLRRQFEYETLYLIGSVAKGKGFHYRSDIDFVIRGLKKELFFKAFALLMKNTTFHIDLKPWEELNAARRTKVEEEGRILQ